MAAYREVAGSRPDYPAVQAAAGAVLATHCARLAGGLDRDALWEVAVALDTSRLMGGFRIDPSTGTQVKHTPTLFAGTAMRCGPPRGVDAADADPPRTGTNRPGRRNVPQQCLRPQRLRRASELARAKGSAGLAGAHVVAAVAELEHGRHLGPWPSRTSTGPRSPRPRA